MSIYLHYVTQEHYLDGKLDGLRETCYQNGQIRTREFFRNGVREGERKFWHPNGQTWIHEFYRNGNREGKCILKRENGVYCHWEISFYSYDNLEGEQTSHRRDGKLYEYRFYKCGKCVDFNFTKSKKTVFLSLKHKLYAQSINDHKNLSNFLISDLCRESINVISD